MCIYVYICLYINVSSTCYVLFHPLCVVLPNLCCSAHYVGWTRTQYWRVFDPRIHACLTLASILKLCLDVEDLLALRVGVQAQARGVGPQTPTRRGLAESASRWAPPPGGGEKGRPLHPPLPRARAGGTQAQDLQRQRAGASIISMNQDWAWEAGYWMRIDSGSLWENDVALDGEWRWSENGSGVCRS